MTTITRSPAPHEVLWELSTAGFAARCLHAVAALGVADHVTDTPVPAGALAATCAVDPDALDRVLRLLATHGVFELTPDGYRRTPASALLCDDHPMSMGAFAQMMGLPLVWGSLAELEGTIRSGRSGMEAIEPKGLWRYLQDHPAEAAVFGRAMTAKAGAEVAAVLAAHDFAGYETIADIGGGRGHLLHAVLDAAPTVTGMLFDLPEVVEALALPHPRMTPVAGDFFVDALPAADAYLLMDVLHDWADDECVAILCAVRRAASPGAALLVVEGVLPADEPERRSSTLDVVMLAVTGGRQRTLAELDDLFARAGFASVGVVPTAAPVSIVEARAS